MKPIVMHFVSKQQPRKEKRCYNTEQWTLNRTVLFILIWHYKLRVKAPKNFILWEKMWKVSFRTGKWKIQRETFPPPATASQSKAEKWELEVFEEMLLTSRAVGRGYNDGGVSYYLETSLIFYTQLSNFSFFLSSQLKLLNSNHFRSVPFHYL